MSVTVILVSYNSKDYLPECLESIKIQGEPQAEVIVVDNDSQDGSLELIRSRYPHLQCLANEQNLGFATAVNQALTRTAADYVLLLNPDTSLLPGALAQMVAYLDGHPQTAGVGPRQWMDDSCTWQWSVIPHPPHWRSLASHLPGAGRLGLARNWLAPAWKLNHAAWLSERPLNAPYLSGACLLLRRTALQAIGGLDEGYFLFFEDVDLAIRLRRAGWQLVFLPDAGVVHHALGSVRRLPDRGQELLLASARRYLQGHGDPFTRLLWSLARRVKRPAPKSQDRQNQPKLAPGWLEWPPDTHAHAYLVEISLDRDYLYCAAILASKPGCSIPRALQSIAENEHFYWRVTSIA